MLNQKLELLSSYAEYTKPDISLKDGSRADNLESGISPCYGLPINLV